MNKPATRSLVELAHRTSAIVDVTLMCVQGDGDAKALICVLDKREGAYFEIPTEGSLALDVYHHPFAYRDFSAVDQDDQRAA
jgi:hypothetical protein